MVPQGSQSHDGWKQRYHRTFTQNLMHGWPNIWGNEDLTLPPQCHVYLTYSIKCHFWRRHYSLLFSDVYCIRHQKHAEERRGCKEKKEKKREEIEEREKRNEGRCTPGCHSTIVLLGLGCIVVNSVLDPIQSGLQNGMFQHFRISAKHLGEIFWKILIHAHNIFIKIKINSKNLII